MAQVRYFWRVVENDVGLVGVQGCVILMVSLCRIERLQSGDLRNDLSGKHLRLIELRDVSLRDAFFCSSFA